MCSDRVAVELRGVSKTYRMYDRPSDRLKQLLWGGRRAHGRDFHALQGLSVSVRPGEVMGVVGRNGAGKSTLLQLLCGTLTPTSGEVMVSGRVAALLELGAGFNPDFTGRENTFLYGAVLGMPREEIERRFDGIVSFAGLADFIDQPVKTYSSGMYVRLAFSIATSVDPDVLVIDEALSVGDGEFARKSFERIMALRDRGVTILLCSHSLYQVEALCSRVMWLDRGRLQMLGEAAEVVAAYGQTLNPQEAAKAGDVPDVQDGRPALSRPVAPRGFARIGRVTVSVDGRPGRELTVMSCGSDVEVAMQVACDPALPPPTAAVTVHAMDGRTICSTGTHLHGQVLRLDAQGHGVATARFPAFPLLKGRYFISAHLLCERGIHLYETADQVAVLDVRARDLAQGVVWIPNHWTVAPAPEESPVSPPASRPAGPASDAIQDPLTWISRHATALPVGGRLPGAPPPHPWLHRLLPRFGFEAAEGGDATWVKKREPRFRLAWVDRSQQSAWMGLFASAFGHAMPPAWWRWKYDGADPLGVGAYLGDELIAFFGGMPRRVMLMGEPADAVQVGDVMVAPSHRGMLTRQGPFQLVAATYLELCIGTGRRHAVGFGFPSAKAMRLAQRLGLYEPVDRCVELSWAVQTKGRNWRVKARPVTQDDADTIDSLWSVMARDLKQSIVGVRDAAHLARRYLGHPSIRYTTLLLRRRMTGSPVGVVVLHDRGKDGVELVDVIGPCSAWGTLVDVGRRFAARLGRQRLFGWVTASHAGRFQSHGMQTADLSIHIPTSVWTPGLAVQELRDRWFLMGGDADFR